MEIEGQELDEIIDQLRKGRSIPSRYRATLFDDVPETELIWPGKTANVERVVLPFQSIEHIDEPRSGTVQQQGLFEIDSGSGRQSGGWTNKLIWGDNKLVLSSLANGPLRDEIERVGGLKMVYIDPPFDVGADFSFDVEVGEGTVTKKASVIEEVAYRDTWSRGRDSYASMIYERLVLIYNLLSSDGSLFVHCDHRVSGIIRLILDELFSADNLLNEIIWTFTGGTDRSSGFARKHNTIFYYTKSDSYTFNPVYEPFAEATIRRFNRVDADGRRFKENTLADGRKTVTYMKEEGKIAPDYWSIPIVNRTYREATNYPTQKPEQLLERIIQASTNENDLVADFFCGSGTTMAVAERLNRRWIGVDLGRFAVHTARKRMISIQRELAQDSKNYRAFEILNLGKYERQYFSGVDLSLPEDQRQVESAQRREEFLLLVLAAYEAQRSQQLLPFHGVKGSTAVFVGPLDAPVVEDDIHRVVEAACATGLSRVDVLGFEFEMGIKPAMVDEARSQGVAIAIRYIPDDVFDKRAIASGQIRFYDVGYLEVDAKVSDDRVLTVELSDFGVFYAQEDVDVVAAELRNGRSRVVVDGGHVVEISKDKNGKLSRKALTESWLDWIDYWAIDFDFESQREIIRVAETGREEEKSVWTGRYIFENEWQDFRTDLDRSIRPCSDPHTYEAAGDYKVGVKVVDVFGNDTTKVITVQVP